MTENVILPTINVCKVSLSHNDDWAELVIVLDGAYSGGKLVNTTPDFSGKIEGKGEIADQYKLSNWIAGITSGVLYAFRALKIPQRRVFLSHIAGSLQASGMTALANATAIGVAKLCGHPSPPLERGDWQVECVATPPNRETETEQESLNHPHAIPPLKGTDTSPD